MRLSPTTNRHLDGAIASLAVVVLLAATAAAVDAAAPVSIAVRVADLNTTTTGGTENEIWESWFAELDGAVVFNVDDGIHGNEPWISDGTPAGTRLLADLCPGVCPSFPHDLVRAGDRVFFAADDGEHGYELWATDGTTAGTLLVADVVPGLGSSRPYALTAWGELLLFAAGDAAHGHELWQSDGTPAGTAMVADIMPGPEGSAPRPLAAVGGRFVVSAWDPVHGRELWATDGTAAGTTMIADVRPGPDDSHNDYPAFPGNAYWAATGGAVYLVARSEVGYRTELWKTDGTPAGTERVNISGPGADLDGINNLAALGDRVVFGGRILDDYEPWVSDGTAAGTERLADVRPGSEGSNPSFLVPSGDSVFFFADDGAHGRELWVTDGTPAGTRMTADAFPNTADASWSLFGPTPLTPGSVLFFGDDGVHGNEPWVSDGTEAGTHLAADLNPGPDPSFFPYSVFGGADRRAAGGSRAFFRALRPGSGFELAVSDGSPAGTSVIEINQQSSAFYFLWLGELYPWALGDLDGTLLFQAAAGSTDHELWRSDGTAAGTRRVADLIPGEEGSYPHGFAAVGGRAVFTAGERFEGLYRYRLWRTDGTAEGTAPLLEDPPLGGELTCAERLGEELLISAAPGIWKTDGTAAGTLPLGGPNDAGFTGCAATGRYLVFGAEEPWVTDGTPAGTTPLGDLYPAGSSYPRSFTAAGDRVFFTAYDDVAGRELWVTDGTPAGTRRAADLLPGPASGVDPAEIDEYFGDRALAALGERVVFAGDDGAGGEELWVSDGTPAGTQPLGDLWPGERGSEPRWLTASAGRVYFGAGDPAHGRELWSTDGTPAGTRRETDLRPGPASSQPDGLLDLGTLLLFTADDGVHGREPFQLVFGDGELSLVADIAPGPLPSSPRSCTRSAGMVYCATTDGVTGFELWGLRLSQLEIFADGFESGGTAAWSAAVP